MIATNQIYLEISVDSTQDILCKMWCRTIAIAKVVGQTLYPFQNLKYILTFYFGE